MEEEIDSSVIFNQPASNVTSLSNLAGALQCFGYSPEDRMEQRELVIMYRTIERDFEAEIRQNAQNGNYHEAKNLRARLTSIRAEFDNLQLSSVQKVKVDQNVLFARGKAEFLHNTQSQLRNQSDSVEDECERLKADTLLTHAIQWENLEHELSLMILPRMKYSKRANELMTAETELIRLHQFDDAAKVRTMLEKIVPGEKKVFYKEFEHSKEKRRNDLKKAQALDLIRLDEKLKGKKWSEVRRTEKDLKTANLRMRTNHDEMVHAHLLQDRLRPEMSIQPSALWTKRQNFQHTSSIMRGQQLLDLVHGKKRGQQVFAESLTSRHDFRTSLQTLQDTYTFADC